MRHKVKQTLCLTITEQLLLHTFAINTSHNTRKYAVTVWV